MENKVVIEVNNVCKSFGDKKVLDHFNLRVHKGESFVILGTSGCGKSVALKTMLGLIKCDSGSVRILDSEITAMSEKELLKHNLNCSMLFQSNALFDSMTVGENIVFGIKNRKHKKFDDKYLENIAKELLKAVGLQPDNISKYPSELSGGMQKRVALARAIATKPEIIFFDEPTTGLDPIMTDIISELIIKCVKAIGASAITITHDIGSAVKIADRIGLMYKGNIIWVGTGDELKKSDNPYVKQFLNGKSEGPIKVI